MTKNNLISYCFILLMSICLDLYSKIPDQEAKFLDSIFTGKKSFLSEAKKIKIDSDLIRNKYNLLSKDLGFNLAGGYQTNSEEVFIDEESSTYDWKLFFGLEWDIVKNGFLGNKLKKEETFSNLSKKIKANYYYYLRNKLLYLFTKEKKGILISKSIILQNKLEIQTKLYAKDIILKDKLISTQSELNICLNQIDNYSKLLTFFESEVFKEYKNTSISSLKVYDILIDQVLEYLKIPNQKKNDQNNENSVYWEDLRLKLYARYNTINSENQKDYFSFGFNFSYPLNFDYKEKSEQKKLNLRLNNFKQEYQESTKKTRLINLYYEYKYKLDDYLKILGRFESLAEKKRQFKIKEKNNNLNFKMAKLNFRINHLNLEFQELEIKQLIYLKLNSIYTLISDKTNISSILFKTKQKKEITNPLILNPFPSKFKNIYCWSKTFNETKNTNFYNLLIKLNIKEVFLSLSDKLKTNKLMAFKQKYPEIKFIGVLSNNSWLLSNKYKVQIQKKIEYLNRLNLNEIHVDIEPHTLKSWHTDRDILKKSYLSIIEYLKSMCDKNNIKISVAIPVHYDKKFLLNIRKFVDKVVIMAYGITDAQKIISKISDEDKIFQNYYLALNFIDFPNIEKIKQLIINLQKFKTYTFTLHKLNNTKGILNQ